MRTHSDSDTCMDKDIVGSSNKSWPPMTMTTSRQRQQQQPQDGSRNRSRTGTDDNTCQSLDNKAFYGVESPDCKWPPCLCWPL